MAAVPILLKVLQTKSQHRIPIQLRWRQRPIARRAPSARRDNGLSPNRPAESSGRCTTTVAPKDPRTCPSKGRHELVIANIYALGIEKWCGSFPVTSGLLRVGLSPRAPVGHAARDRLEIPLRSRRAWPVGRDPVFHWLAVLLGIDLAHPFPEYLRRLADSLDWFPPVRGREHEGPMIL